MEKSHTVSQESTMFQSNQKAIFFCEHITVIVFVTDSLILRTVTIGRLKISCKSESNANLKNFMLETYINWNNDRIGT